MLVKISRGGEYGIIWEGDAAGVIKALRDEEVDLPKPTGHMMLRWKLASKVVEMNWVDFEKVRIILAYSPSQYTQYLQKMLLLEKMLLHKYYVYLYEALERKKLLYLLF
ncbi:hypothetical protein ACH5RR_012127 [Cinchona calisaya]|uniref:Uncharacterized protein n=1 Tax=Cinchona calisaya TaxID=153742 RepID=A0ABD3A9C0_9GENT